MFGITASIYKNTVDSKSTFHEYDCFLYYDGLFFLFGLNNYNLSPCILRYIESWTLYHDTHYILKFCPIHSSTFNTSPLTTDCSLAA